MAGVPEQKVRQWIKDGKLPAIAGNRGRLVRLADVRRLGASEGTSAGTLAATAENGAAAATPPDASVAPDSRATAQAALAARAAEQSAAPRQLRAIDGSRV